MKDEKTETQLLDELTELRQRVAILAEIERLSVERASQRAQLQDDLALVLQAEVARRAKAESALKREKEFTRCLIESNLDGILAFDRERRLTLWNPEMERMSGLSKQACIGKRACDDLPFLKEVGGDEYFDAVLAGERVVAKDRPYTMPQSGQQGFFEGRYAPLYDESGQITGGLGIVRDTTERVQARSQRDATLAALKKSEEKFRTFFEKAPIGMSLREVDLPFEGKAPLEEFNPAMQRFFGYSKQELRGVTVADFSHPEDLKRDAALFEELLAGKRDHYEMKKRFVRKDGQVVWGWLGVTCLWDAGGNPTHILGTVNDITERVRIEKRIERLNHLKETLLSPGSLDEKLKRITDGIVNIFDADFARIWIIEPGDLCDSGCFHAKVTTGPHACQQRERCLYLRASSGRYTHIDGQAHRRVPFGCYQVGQIAAGTEARFVANDLGHEMNVHDRDWARGLGLVSFAGYQLLSGEGQPIGVLALFSKRPISPEQDALLQGLANTTAQMIQLYAQAQELAAGEERQRLAHDLHDAVSQTLFSASLIAEVLPRLWDRKPKEARRRLNELRELTRGALAEMRTLLVELRPATLMEAELEELLRQLTEAFIGKTRIPTTLQAEGECALPPNAQVTFYRIAQEALNNVAKHARASQVTVSLRRAPSDGGGKNGGVELRINDDGRGFDVDGIPPSHFGVSIMRERAEAIGATLKVESQVGQGTRVTVVWHDKGQNMNDGTYLAT